MLGEKYFFREVKLNKNSSAVKFLKIRSDQRKMN